METYLVLTLESCMNLIDRQWFPVYLLQGSVITCCEHNNDKNNRGGGGGGGIKQQRMLSKLRQNAGIQIFTADDLNSITAFEFKATFKFFLFSMHIALLSETQQHLSIYLAALNSFSGTQSWRILWKAHSYHPYFFTGPSLIKVPFLRFLHILIVF